MNVRALAPPAPAPTADWQTVAGLQQRLVETVERIDRMAKSVGLARQVREYNADLRKRCLAIAANPSLKAGLSAAAADIEARSSVPYGAALDQLAKDLASAEVVIAANEAARIAADAARTLLTMQREAMRTL